MMNVCRCRHAEYCVSNCALRAHGCFAVLDDRYSARQCVFGGE